MKRCRRVGLRITAVVVVLLGVWWFLRAENAIGELKKSVETIGRLPFLREVPVKYFDRDYLKEYLDKVFREEYPPETARREAEFLYWMGYTLRVPDLREMRRQILLDNIGGLYNEKTKELLALNDFRHIKVGGGALIGNDMMSSLILVHELRHAVQDQHFPLNERLGDYSDYDDRRLAPLGAIEGDATYVMFAYSGLSPQMLTEALNPEMVLSLAQVANVSSLTNAPDIVRYQLIMPYIEGIKFIHAAISRKKWNGVSEVLRNPPRSSEQLLHPEKYWKRENPLPVSVRYVPPGYTRLHDGVVGEYYLNVLLKNDMTVNDAAAGWGGDSFVLFRNGEKNRVFIWKSQWDDAAACSRFSVDFQHFLGRRFSLNLREGKASAGKAFLGAEALGEYFFLYREGTTLVFLRSNDRAAANAFIQGGTYD